MILQAETQDKLFYDDPYETIVATIARSGKSIKEIAIKLYPGSTPETARAKLSRALSPDNQDVKLCIDKILAILDMTDPELFVNFICDRYRYKRPEKAHELSDEERLQVLQERLKEMHLDEHPKFKGLL